MPKKPRFLRLGPLVGGINTIAEDGSLITFTDPKDPNPFPIELRDQENLTITRRGGLSVTTGFSSYRNIGNGLTQALHRFKQSDGTSELLAVSGGTLYRFTDSSHTAITGATFSTTAYVSLTTAEDYCVVCDGTNAMQKYDGTNLTAVGGTPPTTPVQALYAQNRLFAFSPNSAELQYSDANDIESGWASNIINCNRNDGQKITGIYEYFIPSTLEPVIVVGKERSTGIITGSGSVSSPYTYVQVSQDAGIPGFNCFVQYGQDIAYMTPKGVSSYKTDQQNVNLLYYFLSEKVRDQFQALNNDLRANTIAWHDWKKSRICFAVAEAGESNYNNVIWHFDTQFNAWYKERWNSGQYCTAALTDDDGTVYHGDENGEIFVHDTSYAFDDQNITWRLETDYTDLQQPILDKRIIQALLTARGNGSYSFTIANSLNYGTRTAKTNTISLSGALYTWGGGVWTDNTNTYQWGAAPVVIKKFFPSGWFNNIKLTMGASGSAQPVDIYDIRLTIEDGEFR